MYLIIELNPKDTQYLVTNRKNEKRSSYKKLIISFRIFSSI